MLVKLAGETDGFADLGRVDGDAPIDAGRDVVRHSVARQDLRVDSRLCRALDLALLERVPGLEHHAPDEAVQLGKRLTGRVDDERLEGRPFGFPLLTVETGLAHR